MDIKLLEAFITIASIDVEYLSYEGQTKWNELAKEMEETKGASMGYDKFGADDPVITKIVDYAYNNFDAWFSQAPGDVDYFHDLRYEDEILFMEDRLDNLADHIYEEEDGLVRDLGMDKDEVYNLIALNPETSKEIANKLVDKFYKE